MGNPTKIARYEILDELGRGAMGTVYRAKDPAMDRIVAVKTIVSAALEGEQGSEFRERFYREARAAGALAHPGIVSVFDVGEHEGAPFLVMEFIDGRTLADLLKKGERLTVERLCEIAQKIAEALAYAHRHGVVHRDIKPANILLTSRETHGIERPKITDFGIAKLEAGKSTLTGQILGTPAFMSPEQFTGAPIDGRADIFSLGVILYWMATGEQPFPGESLTAISYKVVHTEPPPPRKMNPSIPLKLENLILRCLEKSPDDRYPTCDTLAQELGDVLARTKSAALQSTAPLGAFAETDLDATLVEPPTAVHTSLAETIPAQRSVIAPGKNPNRRLLGAAVVVAAVLAVGSWYAVRSRVSPPVQETGPPSETSGQAQPGSLPAAAGNPVPAQPPALAPPAPAAKLGENAGQQQGRPAADLPAVAARAKATPPAQAPAVDFDPKALDPKENAKLLIEADQMPADLDFTVEMDGKLYLQRSAAGNKNQFDDLYVPPGIQEFRVRAKSGAVRKTSNTVSAEFKAKKRNTLKIELRTQGMPQGSGVPQGLYENTQLVLTLK